ncbi:MAG: GntR family transcriptional regulator, partial [Spirochaetota bacterium]|nr:GntR family transcriptional regulator [Spirochaetota bacterium]
MASFRTEYQKVSDALRDAILRGDFSPGERLPQRKLADQFGTTTITVREALRTLCSEGLVEIEPKWGATVVELSPLKLEGQY